MIKRVLIGTVAILLLFAGIFIYKLTVGKPFNINHFFERSVIRMAMDEPELLTYVGAIENTIFDFHSHKLTDASPEYERRALTRNKRDLEILGRYNPERISGQELISYRVMEWWLQTETAREPWMYHDYPVNQFFGVQNSIIPLMTMAHQLVNEKSARNYIARLKAIETKFTQLAKSVEYRASRGILPPRFVFDRVLEEMEVFVSAEPDSNILYTHFEYSIHELESVDRSTAEELAGEALDAVASQVYNGHLLLMKTLQALREDAPEEPGVWTLPDGDNFYQYLIRFHTTLDLDAADIHNHGLAEVERLSRELFTRFDELGISGETITDRFQQLEDEKSIYYPNTEEGRENILADIEEMIELLYELSEPLFRTTPQADVIVSPTPVELQENAPFARYDLPAMDGSRPGRFVINLRDTKEFAGYQLLSLTAHEAIPGHHYQVARQMEMENVPTFRNILPLTVFAEGWALYAEQLVADAGLYDDDPLNDIGRLQYEMFRALRLVVDTGIHSKQWSREESIDFMVKHSGMNRRLVTSEVERYIVLPGQALAYKTGMDHILQLREQVQEHLGDRFELADFHEAILKNGSIPLEMLSEQVADHFSLPGMGGTDPLHSDR